MTIAAHEPRRSRRSTTTATFGSGRREAHDATAFYQRFVPPDISTDETVNPLVEADVIHVADARDMSQVASSSVALVVTSPPYFAGKAYEEELGVGGVPANYFEYLELLEGVFAECKRTLEPGGRIAVNVANLGRRPFRSLAGDVTDILLDLGLLLRGEVVWWKGRAAGGSCAWGTFQSPANPVLRDVTERVVIASKGRFDRALSAERRADRDLPSTATISREEFLDATTDLWEMPPERATRVGHPAPFPVELPQRLIELYTYENDVVLDPFMGSGSTAVAAVRTGRRFVGFDTDNDYADIARRRVAEERDRLATTTEPRERIRIQLPAQRKDGPSSPTRTRSDGTETDSATTHVPDPIERALRAGQRTVAVAEALIRECGFHEVRSGAKPRGTGIVLDLVAADTAGRQWAFDVTGSLTTVRNGLRRADVLWKSLGQAAVLDRTYTSGGGDPVNLVLLSTDLPARNTAGGRALAALVGPDAPIRHAFDLLDPSTRDRLAEIASASTQS